MTSSSKQDLFDLANKVEAGGWYNEYRKSITTAMGDDYRFVSYLDAVAEGSLDAAKALHDAVLPGWVGSVQTDGISLVKDPNANHLKGGRTLHRGDCASNPAAAWVAAILRAKASEV